MNTGAGWGLACQRGRAGSNVWGIAAGQCRHVRQHAAPISPAAVAAATSRRPPRSRHPPSPLPHHSCFDNSLSTICVSNNQAGYNMNSWKMLYLQCEARRRGQGFQTRTASPGQLGSRSARWALSQLACAPGQAEVRVPVACCCQPGMRLPHSSQRLTTRTLLDLRSPTCTGPCSRGWSSLRLDLPSG